MPCLGVAIAWPFDLESSSCRLRQDFKLSREAALGDRTATICLRAFQGIQPPMTDETQIELFENGTEPPPDVYPAGFAETAERPPRLERVRIAGLKAFDNTEVTLPLLTVLTGPNNSGKSTVLQAIALGYECLRRCTDTEKWRLVDSGRAVTAFEFLPVNEPRDLWFRRIWKPAKDKERPVEIGLHFDGGRSLAFRIRFLFGVLNIKLHERVGDFTPTLLKALLSSAPVLIPATPGPAAHEDFLTLAAVHRLLTVREPSRVVRNILKRLQDDGDAEALRFVDETLVRYFKTNIALIDFDERRDLELRAPLRQDGYDIDIVSSGSGLNQILQLACIIAWRKPSLVLLDEPDAHLHSSVQIELFDFLYDLTRERGVQVVLSTHSRDLISQAPLEQIVPVDASRRVLEPLKSLDHLLLEYQRYGALSNVDLALLYQTKNCVFLEGVSDARLLPRIAERCNVNVFTGPNQVVPFEFKGVDKLRYLPDLVSLFERLTGGTLRWAVIRDSDCNLPEVKEKYVEQALTKLTCAHFHQWARHSLENYLLEPGLIVSAVRSRKADTELDEAAAEALLESAVAAIEDETSGVFVTRAQLAYRDLRLGDNPHDEGARAATRYLRSLSSLEQKLHAYPGKAVFGKFVERLQGQHGVNLRLDDIVAVLTTSNAPAELVTLLEALETKLVRASEA